VPVQTVLVQNVRHAFLQAFNGGFGREAEVEHRYQITGDHVGRASTGVEVGNLEAGRREKGVAVVPVLGGQFGQCGYCEMNRILGQMRVGHMALHTAHGELGAQRAAPAVFNHVAHQRGARRFADDAPVQTFVAGSETLNHRLGAVMGRAFFVAGNQKCDRTLVVRVVGDEALSSHQHGGQAAFHIGSTTTTKHAVLIDQRIKRVVLPGLHRAGRHYVGVTGEAQYRAFVFAVGGPEVVDVFDAHRLKLEACIAQALHHQLLAVGIDRRHGWATDQIAGKLQGRRKVGVGRHGMDSEAGQVRGGTAQKGGYLKAKRRPEAAV